METKRTFKEKIKALNKTHKIASIIGLGVLLVALGAGVFFLITGTKNQQDNDNRPNVEQDASNDENQNENEQNGEIGDNTGEDGGIIIEDGNEDNSNEDEGTDTPPNNGNQEDNVDEEIKDIMDETTEGEEIVELTQTEIDYINNEIFESEEDYYYPNKFLMCYYTSPEEIDLGEIFYSGLWEDDVASLTEEEEQALISLGASLEHGDINKMPEERVDEVLKKYTGQGIEFFKKQLDESFYYLEEYKAYYVICTDASFAYHKIESGYRTADGQMVLFYRFNESEDSWICKVTVKENEDRSFQFISNEMFGLTPIGYEERPAVISDWESYEYIAVVDAVDLERGKILLQTYLVAETNSEPQYGSLKFGDLVELDISDDVEIIIEAGFFDAYYLSPEVMERLQNSPCFCDKEFFVIVKDGKVVKLIDRVGMRIWI